MDKSLCNNLLMICLLVLMSFVTENICAQESGSSKTRAESRDAYIYDPDLTGGEYAPYTPEKQQDVIIEKRDDQTQLKLGAESLVAPYLGASKSAPPSKDVMPLIRREERESNRKDFKLETGIGVDVNEKVNFNLGYRFESGMSLLEERQKENGQLRFGIHFNYR